MNKLRLSVLKLPDYGKCILTIFEATDLELAQGERQALKNCHVVVSLDVGIAKHTREEWILSHTDQLKKLYKKAKETYQDEDLKVRLKYIKRKK